MIVNIHYGFLLEKNFPNIKAMTVDKYVAETFMMTRNISDGIFIKYLNPYNGPATTKAGRIAIIKEMPIIIELDICPIVYPTINSTNPIPQNKLQNLKYRVFFLYPLYILSKIHVKTHNIEKKA